jgi:hypothetical protein
MFSALVKYTRTLAQHSSRTHPPVNMTYQERALNISQSHIYTARLYYSRRAAALILFILPLYIYVLLLPGVCVAQQIL